MMHQKEGHSLFKSMSNLQVKARIQKAEKQLSHDFKSQPHGSDLKRYKLVDKYLYLQDPNQDIKTRVTLQLSMKVKFETISLLIKNKHRFVGFRIFYNDSKGDQYYTNDQATLKIWIQQLKRRCVLKGFNQYFRHYDKIGKGGFSVIYEVQRIEDSKRFAAKSLIKKKFIQSDQSDLIENQLKVMRQMKHKNVLSMEGIYETENSLYIVTDLLTGGDLQQRIIKKNGIFQKQQIKQILKGLLEGISYLHKKKIVHRDLKPDNIMFKSNDSNDPIIIDLGLATSLQDTESLLCICGTFGYISPQIMELPEQTELTSEQLLKQFPLGPGCDVFAVGVIFSELLTGKTLIQSDDCFQRLFQGQKLNLNASNQNYNLVDQKAMDLMAKMLEYSPFQRISADQALIHPYFK